MKTIDATVERLPEIEREFLRQNCTRCPLSDSRTNIVWGVGNRSADIMVVGRDPDRFEDGQGLPFVGGGYDVLHKVWADVGIDKEEMFLTLMNRCLPPIGRRASREEAATCAPYFIKELLKVRPKVVVTLGRNAFWGVTGEELVDDTMPVVSKTVGNRPEDSLDILVIPSLNPDKVMNCAEGEERDTLMHRITSDWKLVVSMRDEMRKEYDTPLRIVE